MKSKISVIYSSQPINLPLIVLAKLVFTKIRRLGLRCIFALMSYQKSFDLKTPIEFIKGVGPARADLLRNELGIDTCADLLKHYPFRYIDRTQITPIAQVYDNSAQIQVKGILSDVKSIPMRRGSRLTAKLTDSTGSIELTWFRGVSYMKRYLKQGAEYLVFAKPTIYKGRPNFSHPEMELTDGNSIEFSKRVVPVYHSTEKLKAKGLDSKGIFKIVDVLMSKLTAVNYPEFLPQEVRDDYQLIPRFEALKNIHTPKTEQDVSAASRRIKFEEFFFIQMKMLQMKFIRSRLVGFLFEALGNNFNNFYNNHLPFELTNAQKRVLKEIRRDTLSGGQMNRLLQGDVGSGKTIVALLSMLVALDNGFQACLMAPTEILAQQHFNGLSELLQQTNITVDLLTGSIKGKKRKEILTKSEAGEIDILIGTHALIEPTVKFKNLGFVVIDEQHRFGVAQRAQLWQKNKLPPHVLVMTATPIPRTLAMTVYGDLDVSVIDELPPGRKPVKTVQRFDKARITVFQFLKDQIAEGRQVYIVYPLIKESEKLDYKDLMDGYESIQRAFPQPDYHISMVHGQMKPADKEFEMQRFVKGETQIMVATTVIEVGVNVPNASVMIIESAERFGLSQLHQLRGRVGRGADQSFCILMTGQKITKTGQQRIRTMVETNDGFKIAEVDMKLRGPGDIEGTRQSGILDLRLADVTQDQAILQHARNAATMITTDDPNLEKPEHFALREFLISQRKKGDTVTWSRIG